MHLLDTSGGLANEAVGQRPDRPLAKSLKGSLANGGGSFIKESLTQLPGLCLEISPVQRMDDSPTNTGIWLPK